VTDNLQLHRSRFKYLWMLLNFRLWKMRVNLRELLLKVFIAVFMIQNISKQLNL
jgi:hypothetical protein